ncbi:MAG: plasmid mobilization protein [Planctomycetota bacterium]|jgi:predicted HicB family RNase H-like nuclease
MTRTKDKTLLVRITEKQQRELARAAKRSGLSVSDYVRLVLSLAVQSKTIGEFVDRCAED